MLIYVGDMVTRKLIPEAVQHRVFDRSRRRCCLCAHFDSDYSQKEGQIAHIDRDPSNADEEDLAYLCLPHHDDYDTKRRQTKNLTPMEVKTARDRLYRFIEKGGNLAIGEQPSTGRGADRKTLAGIQAAMNGVPDYLLRHPNFGGCSFSVNEIEKFEAVVKNKNKPEHEFIDPELEELRWRFVSEGEVLFEFLMSRLRPVSYQQGMYSLPIEWRESAPDRLCKVADSLDQQAAKTALAYHELVRAARKKLEN